jgi:flagellar biogenesis protein FliO
MSRRRPFLRARTVGVLALAVLAVTSRADEPAVRDGGSRERSATATWSGEPSLSDDADQFRRITPRGDAAAQVSERGNALPSNGSVLAALAVVVLAVFAAARCWKSYGPKLPGAAPLQAVEILGRCRIEPRQSLYIVRLGSRILVIGSSGGELTTLSEITEPVEADLIIAQCKGGVGSSTPFSRLFAARQSGLDSAAADPSGMPAWPAATERANAGTPEQMLLERFRRPTQLEERGHVR